MLWLISSVAPALNATGLCHHDMPSARPFI